MISSIFDSAFEDPVFPVEKIEDSPRVFAIVSEFIDEHYLLDINHSDDTIPCPAHQTEAPR